MDHQKAQVKNLKEKLIRSAYEKHLKEKHKSRRDSRTNLIDDSEPDLPTINVSLYEDEKWDFSLKKSELKFTKLDQVLEVDEISSKGSSSQGQVQDQKQQLLKSNLTGSADEMNVLKVQKSLKKNLNIESDSDSEDSDPDIQDRSKKGKNSLKVKNLRRKSRSWSPSSFYRLIKGSSSSNIYTNFKNINE